MQVGCVIVEVGDWADPNVLGCATFSHSTPHSSTPSRVPASTAVTSSSIQVCAHSGAWVCSHLLSHLPTSRYRHGSTAPCACSPAHPSCMPRNSQRSRQVDHLGQQRLQMATPSMLSMPTTTTQAAVAAAVQTPKLVATQKQQPWQIG